MLLLPLLLAPIGAAVLLVWPRVRMRYWLPLLVVVPVVCAVAIGLRSADASDPVWQLMVLGSSALTIGYWFGTCRLASVPVLQIAGGVIGVLLTWSVILYALYTSALV